MACYCLRVTGKDDDIDAPQEVTTQTSSFGEEAQAPDPWREVTPLDPNEGAAAVETEFATFAPAPAVAGGLVRDEFVESHGGWLEAEDALDGDGPFAAPMDAQAAPPSGRRPPLTIDRMADAFGHMDGGLGPPVRPGVPLSRSPRTFELESDDFAEFSVGSESRPARAAAGRDPSLGVDGTSNRPRPTAHPGRAPSARAPEADRVGGGARTEARPPLPSRLAGGRRRYPKMLALLKDQSVVRRPGQPVPVTPPPVPGTFFPAPREPMEQPEVSDLDQMLLTMAEGLLIGETAEGHTEVRVTLKDEFFAGTELRIVTAEGKVRAVLVPPDREVYWQLSGRLDDLKTRLSDRGLDVEAIELVDP